jgi:L-fuconolactonase
MVTEVIDGKWDKALLQPYFDIVLEAFGPDRLMFGSDWPVCLIQSNYTKWFDTINSLIASLTLFEQSAIMGGNAKRIYLRSK